MKTLLYLMTRLFVSLIALLTLPFAFVFLFSEEHSNKIAIAGFYITTISILFLIERFAEQRRKAMFKIVENSRESNFRPSIEVVSAFANRYVGIDIKSNNILYIDDDINKSEVLAGASVINWEIERDGLYPLLTIYLRHKYVPFIKIRIKRKEQEHYVSLFRKAYP